MLFQAIIVEWFILILGVWLVRDGFGWRLFVLCNLLQMTVAIIERVVVGFSYFVFGCECIFRERRQLCLQT